LFFQQDLFTMANMKIKDIGAAKAQTGRDEVKGADENMLQRNRNSYKVTMTGHECDGGTTDASLAAAAGSLYSRAAANKGARENADPAIQDR
jgi:hypothetical protein